MRTVAIVLFAVTVSCCLGTAAQPLKPPHGLEKARKDFKASLGKAQEEYNKAVTKLADEYKNALQDLVQTETMAGDLDGALQVREELKSLEAEGPPRFSDKGEPPTPRGKWVPGAWVIKYHPNKAVRTYMVRANGEVLYENGKKGQLKVQRDGSLVLSFGDGIAERLTFSGGRLFVEHYNPAADLETNHPSVIGVGELNKKK